MMSRRGSRITNKLRGVVELLSQNRARPSFSDSISQGNNYPITRSPNLLGNGYWFHPKLQLFSSSTKSEAEDTNMAMDNSVQPPVPATPRFSWPTWIRWVLGSILSLILPFWKPKWTKIQMIEEETEVIMEKAEKLAKVVEKVAVVAEKASEEVADKLPEDSKVRKAALLVEHVSEKAGQDAQLSIDVIHKVENIKHDVDDLETLIEPVIGKILRPEPASK